MGNDKTKGFLEKGADIAGGIAGSAAGLMIAGPTGALLGGALGPSITNVFKDAVNWALSNRQEVRVAASASYIINGIEQRILNGEEIRTDFFFETNKTYDTVQELFEGVLLKCKDQYQEKKVKYLSKVLENAVFDSSLSEGTLNQILLLADSCSYRKLCIVSFFGRHNEFDFERLLMLEFDGFNDANPTLDCISIFQDVYDLVTLGVLNHGDTLVTRATGINPYITTLTKNGKQFFDVIGLKSLPTSDILPIYENLQYKVEYGLNNRGEIRHALMPTIHERL